MSKEKILSVVNFIGRMAAYGVMCVCLYQGQWNEATAFGVMNISLLLEQWDSEK